MFKLKVKIKEREDPGRFLGIKFKGDGDKSTIFTLTSYDSERGTYRRNDGEGTPETSNFEYTDEEVKNYFNKHWKLLAK